MEDTVPPGAQDPQVTTRRHHLATTISAGLVFPDTPQGCPGRTRERPPGTSRPIQQSVSNSLTLGATHTPPAAARRLHMPQGLHAE